MNMNVDDAYIYIDGSSACGEIFRDHIMVSSYVISTTKWHPIGRYFMKCEFFVVLFYWLMIKVFVILFLNMTLLSMIKIYHTQFTLLFILLKEIIFILHHTNMLIFLFKRCTTFFLLNSFLMYNAEIYHSQFSF